jgi:signal transduction histidine kinase
MLNGALRLRLASEDRPERESSEPHQRDFLALVGHELRNPLTAIIAHTQLMQRRGAYDERALATILAQAGQLNRLIGDLLDHASLEAGRLQLQPSWTDLVALVRDSIQQAALLSPGHRLHLESPDGLLEGWWDRGRLVQVFANLLGNASKYSPAGGEILLTIDDLGSTVRVRIEDQGVGIAPTALPYLFDRSYRVPATAVLVPGLGLGLHVSKALVEAHGGSIRVESVPDQGTTFSVTLPRFQCAPPVVDGGMRDSRAAGGELAADGAADLTLQAITGSAERSNGHARSR